MVARACFGDRGLAGSARAQPTRAASHILSASHTEKGRWFYPCLAHLEVSHWGIPGLETDFAGAGHDLELDDKGETRD
jgi:hypothetical protein